MAFKTAVHTWSLRDILILFMSFLICVNGDSAVSTDRYHDHSLPLNDISKKENHIIKLYDSQQKIISFCMRPQTPLVLEELGFCL